MKKISLVFLMATSVLFSQNSAKTCEILNQINSLIQKEHIKPKPVDDSLSVFVFDNLINELDPARNIFFKNELNAVEKKELHQHIKEFQQEFIPLIAVMNTIEFLAKKNENHSQMRQIRIVSFSGIKQQ